MHGPRFDLPLEAQEVESHQHVRRLMLFFAVVYAAEGIGQTGRLIAQPLNFFLKEVHGWSPVQISAYLTAFNRPLAHKARLWPCFRFLTGVWVPAKNLFARRQRS